MRTGPWTPAIGMRPVAGYPPHLLPLLALAVEADLRTVRTLPPRELATAAEESADAIAGGADWIVRGEHARDRGARAEFMAAWRGLVRALAIASLMPGGCDAFGAHWCADHRRCLTARLAEAMRTVVARRTPRRAPGRS